MARRPRGRVPRTAALAVFLGAAQLAFAVSCSMQSQLTDAERNQIIQPAKGLGALIQSGNVAGLKAMTLASVAARFDPIAAAVESAAPLMQGASLTVDALYRLDSTDLKTTEDETQFFCGGANSHEVVLSIPQLPPGKYALVVLHATGVEQPQSISLLLAQDAANGGQWRLAGSFLHGLTSAGHDGVWYWTQAREYARKKQTWNAYYYYQTAANLLTPVYFLSSPNLDKLLKEQAAIAPPGLPGAQPMMLSANGQGYPVTEMRTDGSLGGLDLVIEYKAQDVSDPVATRGRNLDVMKAMLVQRPELRGGFHGLWVYANAPGERPFANELPMDQIH